MKHLVSSRVTSQERDLAAECLGVKDVKDQLSDSGKERNGNGRGLNAATW